MPKRFFIVPLLWLITLGASAQNAPDNRLFFKPKQISSLWDTWMFYDRGTYYLYYLITERSPGEGVGLATSADGVNWQERGTILRKASDAQWMGTGSVWKSKEFSRNGTYLMNFSEWRGPAADQGQQTIFFAQSTDLVHWQRLASVATFAPDTTHYALNQGNNSRWDCIYTLPGPNGSRYGYWSANPKHGQPGFGFGQTTDDTTWLALPPPRIDWRGQPPMPVFEVGAVEKIGSTYYLMAGTYYGYQGRVGMITFEADQPQGPFRLASRNRFLLTSNKRHWNTYFARFFPTPQGLLVNHHAISRRNEKSFSLLKRATVDASGTLYLRYWTGNDKLKGQQLTTNWSPSNDTCFVGDRRPAVSLRPGLVMEGTVTLTGNADFSGLVFRTATRSSLLRLKHDGLTEAGLVGADGQTFELDETVDRDLRLGNTLTFRLIVSGPFLELYLDDYLIQCYSLPDECTDVGFVNASSFSQITIWRGKAAHQ